ncbi:MAG: Gfo/Idh/MocA family oxidoreductase [Lewinella sp.]|nr:Gfo/Idh/MocA family oxidoreductase [Lewinella sp.]
MSEKRSKLSRRTFLKQTALTAGAFTIVPRFVLGRGFTAPSDRVTLGFIGLGKQSGGLARRFTSMTEAQIVAASDLFPAKIKSFQERVAAFYTEHRDVEGYNVEGYLNYEEMLERDDIDGILVITPDHWHAIPAIQALKAGKDVYCEKPLSHTIKEGRAMVEATRKYGRVLQTGSMQRSSKGFLKACELVRNGYIGKVTKVLVNVGDPAKPYDLPAEPIPAGFNWDRWCGPSTVGNYNALLAPQTTDTDYWPQWRNYKEYGGGILCDWGAHMFDIAQWGLGMDHTGPVQFIPPTDRNAKRGLRMIYDNGVEMVHEDFGRGWAVRFIGSEGTLDVSRSFLDSKPESIVTAELKGSDTRLYDTKENHYQDWIQAMKNRSKPICDVEIGHRSASVCNLANIAYWLGEPLTWDPAKEKFKGNGQANKLRGKKYRDGFKLPKV